MQKERRCYIVYFVCSQWTTTVNAIYFYLWVSICHCVSGTASVGLSTRLLVGSLLWCPAGTSCTALWVQEGEQLTVSAVRSHETVTTWPLSWSPLSPSGFEVMKGAVRTHLTPLSRFHMWTWMWRLFLSFTVGPASKRNGLKIKSFFLISD